VALILHLALRAAGEAIDPDHCDSDSMLRAIGIVEWAKAEARRIYTNLLLHDEDNGDDQLVDWICRHGGHVTEREVARIGPREYRHNSAQALQRLVTAGRGRWQAIPAPPGGGRASRAFTLMTNGCGDDRDGNAAKSRRVSPVAHFTEDKAEAA
jgi:hypothetical protein